MPTIDVPDKNTFIPMHYEVYGQGIPLVLIHGWLCNAHFWDDFLDFQKQGYQIIVPELRGHGETPNAKEMAIKLFADDIKILLDSLKVEKAIIIGHSMGGLTAQAFYEKYPEKVIALGLWNTGAKLPFGHGIGTTFYLIGISSFLVGLLLAYPITPLFKFILAQGWKFAFKLGGKSPPYQRFVKDVKAMKKSAVMKAAFALPGYNGMKSAKNITVPTMLLHGMGDHMITPIQLAKKLKFLIPHATLYFVDKAAHFPPNEQPEEVKKYLTEFLNSIKNK